MAHPAPRHKTQAAHPIRAAVLHEMKEWGIATLFWTVVASPFVAIGLLGAIGVLVWTSAVIAIMLIVGLGLIGHMIDRRRKEVAETRSLEYIEDRTRQWYMADPLAPLEPPIRWDVFEQAIEKALDGDPWKPLMEMQINRFLMDAYDIEKPVADSTMMDVPYSYDIDQTSGEVIEYISVEQHRDPIPLTRPKPMICAVCSKTAIARSNGICEECNDKTPFPMPEMDYVEKQKTLREAMRAAYAIPGEKIIPMPKTQMSRRQIEKALDGMSEARRRQLLAHLRKAGYVR